MARADVRPLVRDRQSRGRHATARGILPYHARMITLGGVLALIGVLGVSVGFIQIAGKNHGSYEPDHKGDTKN